MFESITAQQSQGDSSSYLPHLRSDQERETPLDTQLEAEGEAGEDEVVLRCHHQVAERAEAENN